MDVFEQVRARIAKHPELRCSESENAIEVFPPGEGTFPVGLFREPKGFAVHFAGWHQHFASPREALDCFSYGLFGECRLRVSYRGSTAHRWTLEEHRHGEWREESSTGLFFFPFWRPARTEILENRLRPSG